MQAPVDDQHFVLLHGDDDAVLVANATAYFADGLAQGDPVLAICSAERRKAFEDGLRLRGCDVDAAAREGMLIFMDADETLARILIDGRTDARLFEEAVGAPLRALAAASGSRVCAYGEMAGALWARGEFDASAALEHLWNELRAHADFSLLCPYPIDVFGDDFHMAAMDRIMCEHTSLVPIGRGRQLQEAIDRGIDYVLHESAREIRPLVKPNHRPAWGTVPDAEATILWLRNNLPEYADEIVAAAKQYFDTDAASA